jgi:hypothetical protein
LWRDYPEEQHHAEIHKPKTWFKEYPEINDYYGRSKNYVAGVFKKKD